MIRVLGLMIYAACGAPNARPVIAPQPPTSDCEVRPTRPEAARPRPEPLRVASVAALRFRSVGKLPELRGLRARAATLDLIASLSDSSNGSVVLTVTWLADGTSTIVELPEALRVESYGAFRLRIDHGDVEVVAIGSSWNPGGLARWSTDHRWSTPISLSAQARKELPNEVSLARGDDRWLVVPTRGIDYYPIWTIDASGTRRLPAAIAAGAYVGATQKLVDTIGFDGGSVLLVDDSSTADGKAAGYPGRTRAVLVSGGRFDELGTPFPWPADLASRRVSAGSIAAIAYRIGDIPTRLLLVDATGLLSDLAIPSGLPDSLQWIDGALVGWGAKHVLPGTTGDGAQPLSVTDMSGWILDPRRAMQPFAEPSEVPPRWMPAVRARIGNELCAWGGVSMTDDEAVHDTTNDLDAARRAVLGAACLDPLTATVRLLAAEPPAGSCTLLGDGAEALVVCRESEQSTLWLVTADPR